MSLPRWRSVATWLVTLCLFASIIRSADVKQATVTKAHQAILNDEVIPAWQQGNALAVLQSLSAVVAKLDDARIEAIDAYLDEQGLPPAAEVLAHARLVLVELNLTSALPKPEPRELLLSLEAIIKKLETELGKVSNHSILDDTPSTIRSLRDYETLFWQYHVLDNRLLTAGRIAAYAERLSASANKLNKKNFSDAQKAVLGTDIRQLAQKILDLRKKRATREFDSRVARLARSSKVLSEPNDLKEKFLAAFFLDLDSEILSKQLGIPDLVHAPPPAKESKSRTKGEDADLQSVDDLNPAASMSDVEKIAVAEKIRNDIASARSAAGDELIAKSRLLFTGLHWWYRGRYGSGSRGEWAAEAQTSVVFAAAHVHVVHADRNTCSQPIEFRKAGSSGRSSTSLPVEVRNAFDSDKRCFERLNVV